MPARKEPVRINLTEEQKKVIRAATGKDVETLELSSEDLAERTAQGAGHHLIELLIVVVIIGILASIAIPKIGAPKQKTYVAAMRSDLRSLEMEQEAYYADRGVFLKDLPLSFKPSAGVAVRITRASSTEWAALATSTGTSWRCVIVVRSLGLEAWSTSGPNCIADAAFAIARPRNPIDSAIQELPWAGVAFNTPERMTVRRTEVVAFVLDPTKASPTLLDSIELSPSATESLVATVVALTGQPSVPVETHPMRYTPRMIARLDGQAFEITPEGDQLRGVSEAGPTDWTWEVTPKRKGIHLLELSADALLDVYGRETPRRFRVLRKEITVRVTWGQRLAQFLGNNWRLILGFSGPPALIVLLWRLVRSRRRASTGT